MSYVRVEYTRDQNKQLQLQLCYHKIALLSVVRKHIKQLLESIENGQNYGLFASVCPIIDSSTTVKYDPTTYSGQEL